jgi:predicted lipid-binding transport protein (Tim44 family)
MSAQMIELLIFAGIAFFIINKLISTLGSTSDEDPSKHKNNLFSEKFGKSIKNSLKDVTGTSRDNSRNNPRNSSSNNRPTKVFVSSIGLEGYVVEENFDNILSGIELISAKLPTFRADKFLDSAKIAFRMIINFCNADEMAELLQLVDRKYLQEFHILSEEYGEVLPNGELEAKISEVYTLANNMFIKVLFTGNGITDKMESIREEWTFAKSLLSRDINWLLINVNQNVDLEEA